MDLSLFIIKTDLKADLETKRAVEIRRYYVFNFATKNKQVQDYGNCLALSYRTIGYCSVLDEGHSAYITMTG